MRRSLLQLVRIALLTVAIHTHGQAHLDILIYQRDGALRAGAFDFGTSSVLESNQVFNVPLSPTVNVPGAVSVNSPGWNAVRNNFQLMPPGAQALPIESSLGFNIVPASFTGRNLSYWNGAGDVKFGPVPSGEVLQYQRLEVLSDQVVADGSSNRVSGYVIASTGPGGYVHRHLSFKVYGNDRLDPYSADSPAAGIYLVALEATVTGFSQPSNPAFVLLGHQVSTEALSLAASAVELTIHAPPTPSDPGGGQSVPPVHSDIFLTPIGGALTVDQTLHAGNFHESDVRGDGSVWATDNPGFAGNGFQFQDELLFDVTGPLLRWNGTNWSSANVGTEQVDFVEPSPFGEPLHAVTVARGTTFAAGYRISRANTRGTIHTHYTFILRATNGLAPAVGAYSFPLTIRSPQYVSAPLVQLVFNNGLSDAAFATAAAGLRAAHEMRLTVANPAAGQISLSLPTLDGRGHQLESAPTLSGPWRGEGASFTGTGGRHELILNLDATNRFFRVTTP